MTAAAHRLEFAPPPVPGFLRAFGLAIIAHALLVAALTWGVRWRHDAAELTAEAELWAQVPVQAAPKPVEAPPPPPPLTVEKPVPATPKAVDPDIVTQREKQRLAEEKRQEDEKQARLDKLAADKKLEAEKKKELKKQEELKLAEGAKRKEALAKDEERKLELQRQENIKRMAGLAGATGSSTATGTAQQAAGPSASYAGLIRRAIKPNIVFTDEIAGNPTAEVEVRTSTDGTIKVRKLLKSSGVLAWDEAVLKAIDKTEKLPRDMVGDGSVPPMFVFSFRPKD
jgi:colicin import membrane protein